MRNDFRSKIEREMAKRVAEYFETLYDESITKTWYLPKKATLTIQQTNFDKYRSYVEDFMKQNPETEHLPPKWLLEKFLKFLHDGELMCDAF